MIGREAAMGVEASAVERRSLKMIWTMDEGETVFSPRTSGEKKGDGWLARPSEGDDECVQTHP